MAIDSDIPLQTVGGNPQKLMSLLDLAMKLKANQQAIQSQNQLKQIFSDPSNLQDGMPNSAGISKMYAVDPQFAMGVQKNVLGLQGQKAKLTEDKLQMSSDLGEAALNEYDDAIKKGIPEPAARQIFDQEVGNGLKTMGSSGLFTPEEMRRLQSTPLTPDRVRAHVLSYKDRMTLERQQTGKTPEEQVYAQFKQEHPDATAQQEADFVSKLKQTEKAPNVQSIALNKFLEEHPDATADEIARFAQKTRAAPRSPAAMAVQQYMAEHPDATADDITKFASTFGAQVTGTRAFSTGQQGNTVRSMNVAVAHLDTLKELSQALNNGDTRKFNEVKNYIKDQFGYEAPGNFDAAKIVIGNEIIKAVIGAAGALGDREEAQKNIDNTKSYPQLMGVIDTYQNLMAGQLGGLQRQYEESTRQRDFDKLLAPRTIEVMKRHGYTPETGSDRGKKGGAPDVGTVRTYNGKNYKFQGGDPRDQKNWVAQ